MRLLSIQPILESDGAPDGRHVVRAQYAAGWVARG